jgi:hypothetical protein
MVTGLVSNGKALADQGRWFTGGGGSVGEGIVLGGSYQQGTNNAGCTVRDATFGVGVGVSYPPGVLVSGYAGGSYTWTFGAW